MEDYVVALAWLATVLSAVGCVLYGIFTWNKGGSDSE
ncbi:symporter small accessory protein [Virgibacillus alimentarius]|nr:symporter small accessory protein [Virgibacillus sp.]